MIHQLQVEKAVRDLVLSGVGTTVTPSEESTKGTVKSGARDGPGLVRSLRIGHTPSSEGMSTWLGTLCGVPT